MDDFDSVYYYENYVKQKPNGSAMPNAKNLILDIDRTKAKLKRSKFCENFGRREVTRLREKYQDLWNTPDEKQAIAGLLDGFDNWCANYAPERR
jgi:hypothetical protein